ncbi:hypothetical protein [Novosphingobium sp.]|uniref:hypothetical protein n=2 Tax=unclassified Novosphingobium TaxID=2644732 RepID=UPI002630279D|nr:hypothetical protein [Novosphingobium sp.]
MRIFLAATLVLVACSSEAPMEADHDSSRSSSPQLATISQTRIMENIERQVQLPPEAQGLNEYNRYYAFDGERVIATYVLSDGNDPRKGQRYWLAKRQDLPLVMDGGCGIVNVIYDPLAKRVDETFCNGVA